MWISPALSVESKHTPGHADAKKQGLCLGTNEENGQAVAWIIRVRQSSR